MLDNAEWLTKLNWIEMLRDVGRHFSVNRMLTHGLGAAPARARAGDELHRVQLHGLPGLRLRRARQAHRLQVADGRLRPVGQHHHGRRSRPPHGHAAAVRADDAAADDRLRRQDGQDRQRRGLAQRRPVLALRFLAVLAQHRRRRRRQIPEAVHDAADGRDRQSSRRCRARRSTRPRRCWPMPRPRCCTAREAARQAAETARQTFEEGAIAREPADSRNSAKRT